tara:strand:- start:720 stop:941 length:222 start_codon:yes stop_codon:yes gene_type:complete
MRQDLPWLWLDHYVSANSKVRRLRVKLDAFEFQLAAVLEPGDFILKPLCFYDLLMQPNVGINHRFAAFLQATV